jgi:hypothetical protein
MTRLLCAAALILCLLTPPLIGSPQKGPFLPGADKILITGHAQFLGYLNAHLTLKRQGLPLPGQRIFLDTLLLTDQGSGIYTGGTPYAYDVGGNKTVVIKLDPKEPLPGFHRPAGEVILGRYAIKNIIQWVYPLPNAVLGISAPAPLAKSVRFRWNYTGAILNTQVTLKDFTTNTVLLTRTLVAESIDIPPGTFVRGHKYRFDLEVVGPMGQFKLTDLAAPGSKIDFYYWDHIYFTVK